MRASSLLGLSTVTASLAVVAARAPAQQSSLGLFQGQSDVGHVTKQGSVTYDPGRDQYAVAGSGANMWFDRDDFHFVWKRIQGNFILTTRAGFNGPGVEPHRKCGWSVRSGLESGSPHVTAAVHGDGLVALQFRRSAGGATEEIRSPVRGADVVQLERAGDTYVLSAGRFASRTWRSATKSTSGCSSARTTTPWSSAPPSATSGSPRQRATGLCRTRTISGAIWKSSKSQPGTARSCTGLPSPSRRPTGPRTAKR